MIHYYIYYKVAPAHLDQAGAAGHAVIAEVARTCRIQGRLLRRSDDPLTLMEIYENVPDPLALDRALEAALARHEFARILVPGTKRITERFEPIPDA